MKGQRKRDDSHVEGQGEVLLFKLWEHVCLWDLERRIEID